MTYDALEKSNPSPALEIWVGFLDFHQSAFFAANLTMSEASNEVHSRLVVSLLVSPGQAGLRREVQHLKVSILVCILWTKLCLCERARPGDHLLRASFAGLNPRSKHHTEVCAFFI